MKIVIYSKNNCHFCTKAKELLTKLGLEYTEKKMEDFSSVDAMLKDIGKKVKSMPQVKIDEQLVGGYNQLLEYFVEEGKINFKGDVL
jgi:thioredoxin reductase (NADPH)